MKLFKSNHANASSLPLLISLGVGILILAVILTVSPMVGYNVESSSSIPAGSTATGTLTITGNVSCGQWVNITLPNGNWTYYQMNFTTPVTGCTLSPNAIAIPLNDAPLGNTSVNASYAFYVAFNDDDSDNISGAIVATNPSNSVVVLTYATTGTAGNSVTTTDTVPGGWASATLTGGVDGSSWSPEYNTAITNGTEVWQQNSPMIAVASLIAIVGVIIAILYGVARPKD